MYKHLLGVLIIGLLLVGCGEDPEIERTKRVSETEEVAKQMNDNILSIIAILQAAENQWVINGVKPIVQDGVVVGYTFTIDGQDPINVFLELYMADKNSYTYLIPIFGIEFHDNAWCWTINGDLLTDGNGDPIPVIPDNPENPIIPQIMIIDDYWCMSIDGGVTWQQLFSITEKNDNPVVDSGKLHDDIFQNIEFDGDSFYIMIVDGQVLVIPHDCSIDDLPFPGTKIIPDKEDEENPLIVEDGAIKAEFSVSANKKVYFSKGNLQYMPSENKWRFAEHQYDIIGEDNYKASKTYDGWLDLFGWGTGDNPTYFSYTDGNYYSTFKDWGANAISNGGKKTNLWRTLSHAELTYLVRQRTNHGDLCGVAFVNNMFGCVLLPDSWPLPSGLNSTINGISDLGAAHISEVVTYSLSSWEEMEKKGAIFLPAAGKVHWLEGNDGCWGRYGIYWTSTTINEDHGDVDYAYCWDVNLLDEIAYAFTSLGFGKFGKNSVRLVRDAK